MQYNKRVADDACRTCGRSLPPRTGRGRAARYCSPACRQKAYRERRQPPGVPELITQLRRQVTGLSPTPADALYRDVTDLATAVGRLRRIAKLAHDAPDAPDAPDRARPTGWTSTSPR